MEVGQRVFHKKYGEGTIVYIFFKDTRRQTNLVQFDNANDDLHDGYGKFEKKRCYCCGDEDISLINGGD